VTTPIFILELGTELALTLELEVEPEVGVPVAPELEHAPTTTAIAISEDTTRSFRLIRLSLS
jgi:hypothetical protein